jgi:hypothetical protein
MDTLEIIEKGENDKKPKSSVSGESKKTGEIKGGTSKKDSRKLAQRNSVTSVRNTEELVQPITLGIVRSTMQVELSKQGSNLGRESPIGMRTSPKS